MKTEAMIDRFTETGQAVLLAETIGREFLIEKNELPEGAERGDYLALELEGDVVLSIELDQEKTIERKSAVQSKLAKLRERSSGSRFKKR
ncbi:DUF3006 domain-containing protein [Amphibacillus indicireducens]|uniref:DUF3006 domain-containing protein n=1 Tax=Amphibacillus indicireducens TaxID=1076330 RepID=A0ABP7V9P2_9BACI